MKDPRDHRPKDIRARSRFLMLACIGALDFRLKEIEDRFKDEPNFLCDITDELKELKELVEVIDQQNGAVSY